MNLTNLLDYANSIFDINTKINTVTRKNVKAFTKPSTCLKTLMCGIITKSKSINAIQNAIFNSQNKRFKNIFSKREFIPKTHAFRDCIDDIDFEDVKAIHNDMLVKLNQNKYFQNHNYRGSRVMIVDGVELFETNKIIDGLHVRNHKDGRIGNYFKGLGIMYVSDEAGIMLDITPFEKKEVEEDKEHSKKVKSEGEITVFKRVIPMLEKYKIEIAVMDCMFLNAPCFNLAKNKGIDLIVKLTDTRRDIYKDAQGVFSIEKPIETYEVVKVIKVTKIKYSKNSKKKDTTKTEEYVYTRAVTDNKINEKVVTTDKTTEHPKKIVTVKETETVIKRVSVWADNFEMKDYEYGKVKVIKVLEENKENDKEPKEMYIVTTLLEQDLEFIVDLMHRRWDIELRGFRKLKSRYNLDHLYIGTDNAIRLILYLTLIIYNLIELYFNIHTKKYRHVATYDNILEEYKIELANNKDLYKYFKT